jgi:hypothetical protein
VAGISRLTRTLYAQEQHADALLDLPNVVAVGTGYRRRRGKVTETVVVQVFVEKKRPLEALAEWERVPETVVGLEAETVRTDVTEINLPEGQQDTTRRRPVPGGSSIGPEATVSAGTLGGWAWDNADDTVVLLTNNHVISNLDTMPVARRVVQPGRLDGGVLPGDVIGSLKRHVAVNTVANTPSAPNPPVSAVDAAIGTITVARDDNVLQIGPGIYELQAPALGMNVQKRGRTTRLTNNGRITDINVTTRITYRNRTRLGRVANTFVITSTNGNQFSAAGDSGSLIFNQQRGQVQGTFPVVGLLFGGGTTADGTPITLANDINAVFGSVNLTTLCTGAVRALIRAIQGISEAEEASEAAIRAVRSKGQQLRRLRVELGRTSFGKQLDEFVTAQAAELSAVVLLDDEAFVLATRVLEPWIRRRTNFDILEARIDRATIDGFRRFATRAGRMAPDVRAQLQAIAAALEAAEGKSVRQVLRTARLPR